MIVPGGRPTPYKPEYAKQAKKMCELGATDLDLAEAFGVSIRTIYRWRVRYPEFCQCLIVEKGSYDDRVERSLAMRAIGYSHPYTDVRVVEGKIVKTKLIKHYPPDVKAALAWLYNRTDRYHPIPDQLKPNDLSEAIIELIKKLPS